MGQAGAWGAMKNLWSDKAAKAMVARYARAGIGRDLALRVYTSRLLGGDPRLVLHGGGNTSVKTRAVDLAGDETQVLCVKGSGWDMAAIEPQGLPAVRLEPLRRLIGRQRLSDEDMVALLRANLLDPAAPNPSVETLLHAFLPPKYVDHTHANAVLALSDQPDGAKLCARVFGDRVAVVPYIMPGFFLARRVAAAYGGMPDCAGVIALKHGVFTLGESAKEAYGRMIALVSTAEARLRKGRRKVFARRAGSARIASVATVAPIVRGACAGRAGAEGSWRRLILDFRAGPAIRAYVDGADLGRYARAGVVTPDHVIRTKRVPLIVPPPRAAGIDAFAMATRAAIARYVAAYTRYFARHNASASPAKIALDPMPRVVLVPGLGLFGMGNSAAAAGIAADIAENTVAVVTAAESVGRFASITPAQTFAMEYWSLEQAKLGKAAEKRLQSQVVVVTGGARGIGAATAAAFAAEGAEIAVLDKDGAAATAQAAALGGLGLRCDVTRAEDVGAAFDSVCAAFGGVDIVVSNAGAAWQGRIGEVDEAVLRASFDLNFFAHQNVARAATSVMLRQGTGGALLFNVSKQAVNPGRNFGPYGLPKAATLFLMRQYAVDYGPEGIRTGAVNADRVRTGLLSDAMIASRAAARGVSKDAYLRGNLLGLEVTAGDVARAFVALAASAKSTGAVLTVDGGNIAAALR